MTSSPQPQWTASGTTATTMAESSRLNSLRKSTPDSEALMSSDDENDAIKSNNVQSRSGRTIHQTMEGSWLKEIHSGPPRRPSAATTTSVISQPAASIISQPATSIISQPATPLDQIDDPWLSQNPLSRVSSNPVQTSWTSANPWGPPNIRNTTFERLNPRELSAVQPTIKTHRSQSYSVGQSEFNLVIPLESRRVRQLPHRPSRPSMLSEVHAGSNRVHDYIEEEEINGLYSKINDDWSQKPGIFDQQAYLTSKSRLSRLDDMTVQRAFSLSAAAEQAVEEVDEPLLTMGANRRFSELPAPNEAARRSQWHNSDGLPDIPQSRRHSLAEIPTRRNSVDTTSDILQHQPVLDDDDDQKPHDRDYAASYFSGVGPALRSHLESAQNNSMMYRPDGQTIFSRPGPDTSLYIVSFKCARAEVYYVAENTGLQISEGDLVVVEADRGHDLGTVLHAKISWSEARKLKAKANEDHYRWLMMFSRHNHASETGIQGGTGGMMAASAMNEENASRELEIKPKMIKRVAQAQEVSTLRDKEGNEAKAKRICQQKVNDAKLDMEILDAEFQTDWKKLTFYYYANSYVNFNVLVTDLFKLYKTRIWMCAINPASLNLSQTRDGPSARRPNDLDHMPGSRGPDAAMAPFNQGRSAPRIYAVDDKPSLPFANSNMQPRMNGASHYSPSGMLPPVHNIPPYDTAGQNYSWGSSFMPPNGLPPQMSYGSPIYTQPFGPQTGTMQMSPTRELPSKFMSNNPMMFGQIIANPASSTASFQQRPYRNY